MTNSYGTTIDVPVNCPPPKIIEQTVSQLPKTGPTDNIIFGGIIAAIVVFFYARSRQLSKEVRLVRREFNTGTL
jgi:LPXTG-motif cell wall-anchored protein